MLELIVDKEKIVDALNISRGVYAPLAGFLGKNDFRSVLSEMRLANGEIWTIPIVFNINEQERDKIRFENRIKIRDWNDYGEAVLGDLEIYEYDPVDYSQAVFGTIDIDHPGVSQVLKDKPLLLGARVLEAKENEPFFSGFNLSPQETKKYFKKLGWNTVSAFQTRNVPHLGHEFLQKEALKQTDGIMIQPVIGPKKVVDFKDEYIIASYKILLENYFSKDRAFLNILPLKMRYAGPREAVMHALIRKNYGCTHFLVGRDHAGVGDYYHPIAAQEIFNNFPKKELGIEILKFSEVAYDKNRQKHAFIDEIAESDRINFSGTKIRDFIKNKKSPPDYLIRPEVYNFLINSENSLIDSMYQKNNQGKGFVLWFTGLSAAGKTTIADAVYKYLNDNGWKLERLDGDVVRENLTKDLGFTKKDRDENIRRIGFVANLLSKNGVGVLASFISPYRSQRDELKNKVHNFIEIFVDTPLDVCEQRDPKGMYKKARTGEIRQFTGISDPYEAPIKPDIHLMTPDMGVDECAKKVMEYLVEKELIEE